MEVWTVTRFVHELALAFFVGGQLVLIACVVPLARLQSNSEMMRAVARRFGYWSLGALALLLATGAVMAHHLGRWDDGAMQLKLVLVAVIGALTAGHVVTPHAGLLSAGLLLASLAVVWLGVGLSH